MTLRLLALLLVVLNVTACRSHGGAKSRTEEFTVATYNIRAGLGLKGSWSGHDPRENLQGIAAFLLDTGVDVVLLQEVDMGTPRTQQVREAEVIAEAMGFHHAFAPAIPLGTGHFGVAVLSRWPILESQVTPLYRPDYTKSHPEYPGYYSEQRVLLRARVDVPGGPVTFLNTHLGLTPDQRERQMAEIAAEIDRRAGEAIVFGGDLNATPEEPTMAPIRSRLTDSYTVSTGTPPLTFHAEKPDRCIDYLFLSAAHLEPLEWNIPETTLSDHLPVVVRVRRR